jgi:hypothetical protein
MMSPPSPRWYPQSAKRIDFGRRPGWEICRLRFFRFGPPARFSVPLPREEFADLRGHFGNSIESCVSDCRIANCGALVTLMGHGKEP